jgi:hypothetical protein
VIVQYHNFAGFSSVGEGSGLWNQRMSLETSDKKSAFSLS